MNKVAEEWRHIPGYEGRYEVSTLGNVRSLPRRTLGKRGVWTTVKGKTLTLFTNPAGYKQVTLYLNGAPRPSAVHRLVLEAFVGPCPKDSMALHWDDDKSNNYLSNLRWGTRSENSEDSVRNGTHHEVLKTHCPKNHALVGRNLREGSLKAGRRDCKACSRERETARREGREFSIEESNLRYEEVMAGVAKPHANQYTRSKERM